MSATPPTAGAPAGPGTAFVEDVVSVWPRIGPARWIAGIALALVAVLVLHTLVTNPRFEWPTVWRYLFNESVLSGLGTTLLLTVLGMVIGVVIGTVAALTLLSNFGPGRWAAETYLWAFRATPLLIQLIFWYNLAYLLPKLWIGVPGFEPWIEWSTNEVITPFVAAMLGLGLAEGAYMTEIVRAGLLSVDPRQRDAARAVGMTPAQSFWRIVLPQALRFIIPPTGNQVIGLAKATALVSVIAMHDLLHSVQLIYNRNFAIVPLLLVAVFWYLMVITVMYFLQGRLEAHYSRGQRQAAKVADAGAPAASI